MPAIRLRNGILEAAVAALSGALLSAAFPPHGHALLAWVALAPVFLLIFRRKPAYAFLLSLICGCTFFLGIFSWILVIEKYTYLHHAILAVYLGSYFAVFGALVSAIVRFRGVIPASAAAPFIWVALEYLRAHFSFLALPWGLLAHSQYQMPAIIQAAAIAGTYGVSFLIVLVNAALATLGLFWFERRQLPTPKSPAKYSKKSAASFAGSAIAIVLLVLVYGVFMISRPLEGRKIKVAVVQGNIEQSQKWDKKFAPLIMRIYTELTMAAALDKPDLIVWPETATPKAINTDPKLKAEVRRIAESAGSPLLLGSSQVFKFKKNDPQSAKVRNSAYLVPPDPALGISQQYDKIKLFPFGEYLPYKNKIPWDYINVPDVGNYIPGKEFKVFKLADFQFSATICWENLFSDFVRQFVKAGAQFIVNMTNEAWFGPSGAPHQFVSMNVFRAVENRVYVIRCTNTGISCFIDPHGRIINTVRDENGKAVFVRGVASSSIIPQNSRTVYTRFGDWFAWFSVLISISFLLFCFVNVKNSVSS